MNLENARTVINDARTAYILRNNQNFRERLLEAYNYIKAQGVNTLEEFTTRRDLKVGAFTYDQITIFDRLKDEAYKEFIINAFDYVTNMTVEISKDPFFGDKLASWGTLGNTPYRQEMINRGDIVEGLTDEERSNLLR